MVVDTYNIGQHILCVLQTWSAPNATPTNQHSAFALLANVPCRVAALVAPFVNTRAPATKQPFNSADREDWDLQQPALWDAARPFDAWVCGVVSVLLRHVDDPLLMACRGVAKRRAALAAHLMPLALENIAVQGL